MRLESLDAAVVPAAIADFERAVALDPRYAAAHVGLGNARFWQYEMSRARNQPDGALLARAIDHVRRAIELERDLAEAHATLAFLLMSAGRAPEALAAARRAVALEPGYWGNQFRLAHAAWGEERLQALGAGDGSLSGFSVRRTSRRRWCTSRAAQLDRAESVLREGTIVQDRQADLKQRYPAKGLHWLLGLVRLARGDAAEALLEFDREIASGAGQLYAPEFAMNAHDGAGFAHLRTGDAARRRRAVPPRARAVSRARAVARRASAPRSARDGDARRAPTRHSRAPTTAIDVAAPRRPRRRSRRSPKRCTTPSADERDEARARAAPRCSTRPDLPFTGWTIPIEPLLDRLRGHPAFAGVLAKLAERAR